MSINTLLAIIVTSLATYSSRFLGVISSVKIKETSKVFRWFNCLAYATLAALIARTIIFPVGALIDASYSCISNYFFSTFYEYIKQLFLSFKNSASSDMIK